MPDVRNDVKALTSSIQHPASFCLKLFQLFEFRAEAVVICFVACLEREVGVAYDAPFVDQENGAFVEAARFVVDAVDARDFVVVVGEQRELQLMKLRPFLMRENVVAADA